MSDAEHVVVYVTVPIADAARLARGLVERRAVACVNIVPAVRSIYSWQGEICDDEEALLVIKTRAALFETLRLAVVEQHPYDVPEIIALPITAGHAPYLSWIDDSTVGD